MPLAGLADDRATRVALIDAAGGNAALKNAPSYLQLMVRRELDKAGLMDELKDRHQLKLALDRKPELTLIKVCHMKEIPKDWRDEMIAIFG